MCLSLGCTVSQWSPLPWGKVQGSQAGREEAGRSATQAGRTSVFRKHWGQRQGVPETGWPFGTTRKLLRRGSRQKFSLLCLGLQPPEIGSSEIANGFLCFPDFTNSILFCLPLTQRMVPFKTASSPRFCPNFCRSRKREQRSQGLGSGRAVAQARKREGGGTSLCRTPMLRAYLSRPWGSLSRWKAWPGN